MTRIRIVRIALLLALLPPTSGAQGVATTGIQGIVTSGNSQLSALIEIADVATGFAVSVRTANGRFLATGLDPGRPYTITVHSIGFTSERRTGVILTLGNITQMRFVLETAPARLDTLTVVAERGVGLGADGGASMRITQSLLDHLLTLDRNIYDFLSLVPQISAKISLPSPGVSAAGIGFRFNNFLIDGVSERTPSGGVSHVFGGGTSIPLDAVEEYQVLIAPYDIRYGDFAGAIVNTVTKSGTNSLHGSAFAYGRNDQLQRRTDSGAESPYDRVQYGFSLGGPIIRRRMHFFVASELQQFRSPADGPYSGEPDNAARVVPVSSADLERLTTIMNGYGMTAGSAGKVENGNPLHSLFSRIDLALPGLNSRVLAWSNYSSSEDMAFSRAATDTFSLSSYQVTRVTRSRTSALDIHTALPRASGGHNEFLVSYRSDAQNAVGAVDQPIVRVSVPAVSGGRVTINTGTHESAQGLWTDAAVSTIKDNLTIPLAGEHVLTLGAEAEHVALRHGGSAGEFGTWGFSSLQNLELGVADTYDVRIDFGNSSAPLHGTQYALYAGDQWIVNNSLSLTAGIRGDVLDLREHAPYNHAIDSIFGRRTDQMPRQRTEISPRFGFVWQPVGSEHQRIRGGAGIFTGRYPLAWAQSAVSSYGVGGLLHCTRLRPGAPLPPTFSTDPHAPPASCIGGATVTPTYPGDVDLLDPDLRLMRVLRGSLAYDRELPFGLTFTNEAVLTHGLTDFALVNLNLADPTTTDPYGRVMYGAIATNGVSTPNRKSSFSEVIDLRNTSATHSYELSTRLEKKAGSELSGSVSYTYSHARDAETLLRVNTRGTAAWASARVLSNRQDELNAGISSNDVPHRVVATATFAAPWSAAPTSFSFAYIGESGRPFTFVSYGSSGRGDLNADGSNANDPIYVPRSAFDSLEINFSGASDSLGADNSAATQASRVQKQRTAFENFIQRTSCLRAQRGQILARNTCREPWSNSTIASVRQTIPVGGQSIEMQLDLFNVLNLLNGSWGQYRQAAPALLEHVGQTAAAPDASRPIFRFHSDAPTWNTLPSESDFQLQLSLRYRF
jgi:hypothetical protein